MAKYSCVCDVANHPWYNVTTITWATIRWYIHIWRFHNSLCYIRRRNHIWCHNNSMSTSDEVSIFNVTTITCATWDDISIYDLNTIVYATSHDVSIHHVTTIACATWDETSTYDVPIITCATSDTSNFIKLLALHNFIQIKMSFEIIEMSFMLHCEHIMLHFKTQRL